MKAKKTKIVLKQGKMDTKRYVVVKLVNRVVPEVGSELTRDEVQCLLKSSEDLTIEIQPNMLISQK